MTIYSKDPNRSVANNLFVGLSQARGGPVKTRYTEIKVHALTQFDRNGYIHNPLTTLSWGTAPREAEHPFIP
jgi:hypothetical protein